MSQGLIDLLISGTLETLYMVFASSAISFAIGLPLGVVMSVTSRSGILHNAALNSILSFVVNVGRSVTFIILMIAIIPLTRLIVGTSIGTNAAIVPLAAAAVPFVARVVEGALREIDPGVIEAAQSMGATPMQIILKVMLPEGLPSILTGLTLTVINLIGYSAMAGTIGGGGLGDVAIRYGYQRFMLDVMITTVVILVLLVQICQYGGDRLAAATRHDKRGEDD